MITSFLVQPTRPGVHYLVFDTAVGRKHVFTACGVGRIERGEPRLTATASATLDALMAHADNPATTLVLREIATVAAAPVRVRRTLEQAGDKHVVLFVCRSDLVYDAAIVELHPQWTIAGSVQ